MQPELSLSKGAPSTAREKLDMDALLKLVANTGTYVIGYVLLMAPTYLLPYLGSNSSILNSVGAASGAGLHPLLFVHVVFLAALVVLAWARGKYITKTWLFGLPLAAAFFDIVPGLSLIPLAPTALHLAAIIVGVQDNRKATDA